jgi:hypothetical protein
MKARPFLAVVLAVAVSLLSLGIGGWWFVLHHSPLQLQNQALVVPAAARFVPRLTPLSLYWLADPEQPVVYARAVAPSRQRRLAADTVARLRDGAFAAAGIDYAKELASWIGPETSLALIPEGPGDGPQGWLLALRSRSGDGARRFLQRFWQARSLTGTDLQISTYRGMGLISGRGALVGAGDPPVPLATALINDDLVLIASGRSVLQQALDVSQIDDLNQAASPQFLQGLQRLGQGSALLTARPTALSAWLGVPADGLVQGGVKDLMAALRPEQRTLAAEAWFQLAEGSIPWRPLADPSRNGALLAGVHGEADSLALLQNPAAWPGVLQGLLQGVLAGAGSSPIPALVAAADGGPLLWTEGAQGWLIATGLAQPTPEALDPALAAQGLLSAPLAVDGSPPVRVWTHLEAGQKPKASSSDASPNDPPAPPLQASLEGARSTEGTIAWWGQNLEVLKQQRESHQGPKERQAQVAALEMAKAPLQWALGPAKAQELLQRWTTWRLLSGLAGQPLAQSVDGLAVGLESGANGVHLKARLSFG